MSGRHRKPIESNLPGRAAMLATTGAFAAVPMVLSAGTASAAEAQPTAHAPTVNWDAIIKCESGGNPRATNSSSTASGLFQFVDGSWKAYGGSKFAARAKDATPAEQLTVANTAFARSGLTPWAASRHCWKGKENQSPSTSLVTASATKPAPSTKSSTRSTARSTAGRHRAPTAAPTHGGSYTVVAGDTLSGIAQRHGMSWQSIWNANKSAVPRANMLHPGEQLTLPKATDLQT